MGKTPASDGISSRRRGRRRTKRRRREEELKETANLNARGYCVTNPSDSSDGLQKHIRRRGASRNISALYLSRNWKT